MLTAMTLIVMLVMEMDRVVMVMVIVFMHLALRRTRLCSSAAQDKPLLHIFRAVLSLPCTLDWRWKAS